MTRVSLNRELTGTHLCSLSPSDFRAQKRLWMARVDAGKSNKRLLRLTCGENWGDRARRVVLGSMTNSVLMVRYMWKLEAIGSHHNEG